MAGDGIWSECYGTTLKTPITYIFHTRDGYEFGTLSPIIQLHAYMLPQVEPGRAIKERDLTPAGPGRWALPLETFGRSTLRHDLVHPDQEGDALIAEALADLVENQLRFRRFIEVEGP